jgi:hypothetical protein
VVSTRARATVWYRFVRGAKIAHRRLGAWRGRSIQNTIGAQVRNDAIRPVGPVVGLVELIASPGSSR